MSTSLDIGCVERRNRLIVNCPYDEKEVVKKIGANWRNKEKFWYLPLNIWNIRFLQNSLNPPVLLSQKVEDFVKERNEKNLKLFGIKSLADENATIQFKVPGVKLALYPYQKLGIKYAIVNEEGVLIADEMGLGKTIQGIGIACFKKYMKGIKKCLVVTPASLKWNWPLEIEKFTDEKYVVIDGPFEERYKQWFNKEAFFYIVNYELIIEDLFGGKNIVINESDSPVQKKKKEDRMERYSEREKMMKPILNEGFEIMIVDEIHSLKSHSARRTKAIKKMAEETNFRLGLSGTPIDGKLEELHSVMQFVCPDLFPSKTKFLERYAVMNKWIPGKIDKYVNIQELKERIQPFFIRRLKKDVLKDLPDKIYQDKIVILSEEERKLYKELKKGKHIVTTSGEPNPLTIALRCKQFCDLPALASLNCKSNSKLDIFKELLEELVVDSGSKVVIFSQYSTMNEYLIKEIEKIGLNYMYIWGQTSKKERVEMQQRFNEDPKIDIMIGTDAMSQGLNLTSSSYVINYDDAWSPSIMNQRSDRCHRIGQKNVVNVINFICKDTVEERIRSVLYSKTTLVDETLGDNTDEMILKRLDPKVVLSLIA